MKDETASETSSEHAATVGGTYAASAAGVEH